MTEDVDADSPDKEVSEEETQTGIVIGGFTWIYSEASLEMVFDNDGRPNCKKWAPTHKVYQAYHWKSRKAAEKYLREHPELKRQGYQVIELSKFNWPNHRLGRDGRTPEEEEAEWEKYYEERRNSHA